jgi:uncharacterized small protein (TIGR04563 family)
MASTDKQKQSLYFPDEMLREIMKEATRLDRSLSWTVQQAWRVAREELKKFPAVELHGIAAEPAREPGAGERSVEPRQPSAQVREFLRGKFDSELAG